MKQVFSRIPRSRTVLETRVHSPWVSRLLAELDHEVVVAHARNVRLIGRFAEKRIGWMHGHWSGWRESIPAC
jgi:hypothetical protein